VLEGADPGTGQNMGEIASMQGVHPLEDDDGSELMFTREDWSEDRKKASHSPVGKGRGRDWSGQLRDIDLHSDPTQLRM